MGMSRFVALVLVAVFFISGCAAVGRFPIDTTTQVRLEQKNYRILKANAAGASSGFFLFGFIPITSPQHTIAMTRLYKGSGFTDGGSYALANVVQEETSACFILFSIPTYRVRADVVEFTAGK